MENSEVDSDKNAASTSGTSKFKGPGDDRKLVEIFVREIDREIADRMGVVSEISDNIKKCQRLLDRLRKEAVIKYYMDCKELDVEADEQHSIHPAVKKLIGKRPREVSETEQFMKANMRDWKRQSRKKSLHEYSKNYHKYKNKRPHKSKVEDAPDGESVIRPRYVPPNIPGNPQENSSLRGNTSKIHMRVLVGNVAKQIAPEPHLHDPATHKWMVYVRSAPGSLSVEQQVSRVRFFLHPSYKPHDIVTVPDPPFTLNRRGWGEFPMRVQLCFKNRLNKPADIIHHLKLSGARSGHHTRSAETFADLWIYAHENASESNTDSGANSKDILWLASDMLKEEVPDFTSEVICHKCLTTSMATDSYNCSCNTRDITQDSSSSDISEVSSESSSEESETTDSEDSLEECQAPKPLRCMDTLHSMDTEVLEDLNYLMAPSSVKTEEVSSSDIISDEEYSDEFSLIKSELSPFVKEQSNNCTPKIKDELLLHANVCVKSDGEDFEVNPMNDLYTNVSKVKTGVDNNTGFTDCFSSTSTNNQYVTAESDMLNVEPSDIFDALEIKQEIKEEVQENTEIDLLQGCKSSTEVTEASSETQHLIEKENQVIENIPEQLETEVIFDHEGYGSTHLLSSSYVSSAQPELMLVDSLDGEDQSATENVDGKESFVQDFNMEIEEVPIDEFINNIEEEIVVEILESSAEEVCYQSNVISESPGLTQKALALSEQNSSSVPKIVIDLKHSKNFLPCVNGTTTPVSVKVEKPLAHLKKPAINEELHLIGDKVQKKIKVDPFCQTYDTKEKNIMKNQLSSLIIRTCKPVLAPASSSVDTFGSQIAQPITKTCFSEISKENSCNLQSLLKPQFRNAHTSKPASRNPNSLLKPTVQKSHIIKSNPLNVQTLQKPIQPGPRLKTFSVLRCSASSKDVQQKIRQQNCITGTKNINSPTPTSPVPENRALQQVIQIPQLQKNIIINPKIDLSKIRTTVFRLNKQETDSLSNASKPPVNKLSQEINRLQNCILKKNSETLRTEKSSSNNSNKTSTGSPKNVSSEYSAPQSDFKTHSEQICFFKSRTSSFSGQEKSDSVHSDVSSSNIEKSHVFLNPNSMKPTEDVILFNELIKVVHFPRTSVPSRPISTNSSGSETEVRRVELESILSCNNIHSDLQRTHLLQYDSQFGKKAVMANKDQINSTINDLVLYYLEQLRLLVNTCKFDETELAVRWLVRGLPLVHPDARTVAYKMVHPYSAASKEVYCSWPPFKQAAAEWLRAKTVVRLLLALKSKGVLSGTVWTTRIVYWWSRTHGYSPAFCLIGPDKPANTSNDCILSLQRKTPPTKVLEWMASMRHNVKLVQEEDVDVVRTDPQECENGEKRNEMTAEEGVDWGGGVICGRPWVQDMHRHVVNELSVVGAKLAVEPLTPGGPQEPVAATLLTHVTVSLAEDLLRRALAYSARRGSSSLDPRDVCRAILKRQEFDVFTGQGLQIDSSVRDYLKNQSSKHPS